MDLLHCRMSVAFLLVFGALSPGSAGAAIPGASLTVVGERFELALPDGKRLTSADLVGAELQTQDGQTIRIDAVTPAMEQPSLLLHSFSVRNHATGVWEPLCDPDYAGRRVGLPVAGAWSADGRYLKRSKQWYLACTAGSRGKCIVWGYDPWGRGPHGEDLAPFYRACQFTARANYDGRGDAHTRDGTRIDLADILNIQTHDSLADTNYIFEAGWGPDGAVCVAATRWPELLTRADLLKTAPHLSGSCTEDDARRRGALVFTRVVKR